MEQLIKKNLVLNRNKVLRARKKKDVDCFQTGILCLLFECCDVFLSPFIFAWSLVDSYKKKSYCLMIVVATVEHHTSQSSAFQEIKALILLVFVFSFSFPIFKEIFQIWKQDIFIVLTATYSTARDFLSQLVLLALLLHKNKWSYFIFKLNFKRFFSV